MLGVGRAAGHAEAAIDAGVGEPARRREGRERRLRPLDAHRLAPFGQHARRGVERMRAIGIARSLRSPRIGDRAGDLQRLLDLAVVVPHFAPIERPVGAVAEQAARLEPFGTKAQRHHGEMHGASRRPPCRCCCCPAAAGCRRRRCDRRSSRAWSARFRRRQNPPAAGSRDRRRTPRRRSRIRRACRPACRRRRRCRRWRSRPARLRHIRASAPIRRGERHPGARPCRARGISRGSSNMAVDPARLSLRRRCRLRPLPTGRARRNPAGHSRAGWPDRPSRFRSTPSDARNRRGRCRVPSAS